MMLAVRAKDVAYGGVGLLSSGMGVGWANGTGQTACGVARVQVFRVRLEAAGKGGS